MDSMDNCRERFEAVEQQTAQLKQQTHALEAQTRMVARRRHWWSLTGGVVVAVLGFALACPLPVQAKTFACGASDVACLSDAINQANANGDQNTIRLAAGTYTLTAVDNVPPELGPGGNGLPVITSILTIRGQEAETTIIERAAGAPELRLLHVAMAGTLTLQGLTLRGGFTFRGGGLFNQGTVTLRHCMLTENEAYGTGAGILNQGTLTLRDSILRDNIILSGGGRGRSRQRWWLGDHHARDF
jgi:hypothetical protein